MENPNLAYRKIKLNSEQVQLLENYITWLKAYDYQDIANILSQIQNFMRFLISRNLSYTKIELKDCLAYINSLDGLQNNSINNHIKKIKSYCKYLRDIQKTMNDKEVEDIVTKLKYLPEEMMQVEFLEEWELEDLVDSAMCWLEDDHGIMPEKSKAILYFLYYTGVRESEFLQLKRANIEIDNLRAFIGLPSKSRNERWVYFPPKVAQALKEYFELEYEGFKVDNAFNMNHNDLKFIITKLKAFAPSGKNLHLHLFRHGLGQKLAKEGVNIAVVQKIFGHANINSTSRYYQLQDQTAKEEYLEKIAGIPKSEQPVKKPKQYRNVTKGTRVCTTRKRPSGLKYKPRKNPYLDRNLNLKNRELDLKQQIEDLNDRLENPPNATS